MGLTVVAVPPLLVPGLLDESSCSSLILMTGISDLVDAMESVHEGFLVPPVIVREAFLPAGPIPTSSGNDTWSISVALPSSSAAAAAAAA
jgi:hypothetical protein